MSDSNEYYEFARIESQERRAKNRERSTDLLKQRAIEFVSKNNGTHLIVTNNHSTDAARIFDFWPSTGKYKLRGDSNYKRGIFNLIKEIKQL